MAFLKCMGKLEMSLESEAVFAVHPFCIQPTCSSYWWSCRRECASSHSQFTIHLSSVYTIWILYEFKWKSFQRVHHKIPPLPPQPWDFLFFFYVSLIDWSIRWSAFHPRDEVINFASTNISNTCKMHQHGQDNQWYYTRSSCCDCNDSTVSKTMNLISPSAENNPKSRSLSCNLWGLEELPGLLLAA